MKKLILSICFVLLCGQCYAGTAVYYYKDSKEVIFIGEESDRVILSEEEKDNIDKIIISDKVVLTKSASDYKVSGKDIIINLDKISKEEQAKNKQKEIDIEMAEVIKKMKEQAFDALEADGYKFKSLKKEDL